MRSRRLGIRQTSLELDAVLLRVWIEEVVRVCIAYWKCWDPMMDVEMKWNSTPLLG